MSCICFGFYALVQPPDDGIYTCYPACDDGSRLQLVARTVILYDGFHGDVEASR